MKEFNTIAVCIPEINYMVDLSERVREITKLIDRQRYFEINRARQYGKSTTIAALERYLSDKYDIITLDFQDMTDGVFANENAFTKGLAQVLCDTRDTMDIPLPDDFYNQFLSLAGSEKNLVLNNIFRIFDQWCDRNEKSVVLIVDEVDSAANNQVFLDFLGKLRSNYLKRQKNPRYRTFQSVILAGVTDVRHLKSKIREENQHKENSPWNIAADFQVDMSLSETGIRGMLDEYESDHHTGMDTAEIARQIRGFTNGYPFLVSRICQILDEQISRTMPLSDVWTRTGLDEAFKLLIGEDNTLFQSLTVKLNNYPDLKRSLRSILMEGTKLAWNPDQTDIAAMCMYGFLRRVNNTVRIDNCIFETRLYNLFLSDEELKMSVFSRTGDLSRNQFVQDGKLNMRLILKRFIETYTEVFGPLTDRFREKDGREFFLLYLKPIINGTGNYYIESQTRDQTRTDVIVDYLGQQFVIELKIWYGNSRHEKGERQIIGYLDYFGLSTGYMLSFNFNKKKQVGVRQVHIGDKILYEGTL